MRTLLMAVIILITHLVLFAQLDQDPLCIGCEGPTFSLPSLDQEYVSLRDFCGKKLRKPWINKTKYIVVLSFFATWCEPCKKEIPHLEKLMQEFKDQPIKFFLIDVGEEREKILDFTGERNVAIPILMDRYQKTSERYDALTLPRLYVLDQDGLIQRKQKGFTNPEDFEIEMKELITLLLQDNEIQPDNTCGIEKQMK